MDKQKQAAGGFRWRWGEKTLSAWWRGCGWGLCAFLLGRGAFPFGAYPLGIGLLCGAEQNVGWILLGLVISAFSLGETGALSPWVRVAACCFGAAVRLLARLTVDHPDGEEPGGLSARIRGCRGAWFGEAMPLRMATACVSAFFVGVWGIVAGGYRYYDLFSCFVGLGVAPLACLLYSPLCAVTPPRWRDSTELPRLWGMGALMVSLCFSVREVELFGISAGAFLAFVLVLGVTRLRGIGAGAVIGLLCGLCISPLYAPLFLIAAGTAGLLWPRSSTAAITLAAILGILWGGYVEGLTALVRLVPALVCGAVCLLSADRFGWLTGGEGTGLLSTLGGQARARAEGAVAEARAASAEARMQALSDTFSDLSRVCYQLSDRLRRPDVLSLRRLCDETCDRFCPSCAQRKVCWEQEYGSTVDVLGKLTLELHRGGRTNLETVPEYLRLRCPRMPVILDEINRGCARLWADTAAGERTECFAVDYEAVSAILAETLAAEQADYGIDEALTARVREAADSLGLGSRGILVYGERRKQILAEGLDLSRAAVGAEDLRRTLSAACGFALTPPVFSVKEERISLRLSRACRFGAECVQKSAAASPDEACGDSIHTFRGGEGDFFYALLSDGMGSGREAALTARICTVFLEKMLTAGNRKETALRLLNSFVRAKGIECSATVDLMELDLITGRAGFIKSGAAPSYVRRDGNLFKLQSKTVPIGIMRALDAEQLCFDVEAGDVIIMLSDGIAQSFEESVWLLDLLSCGWPEDDDLERAADLILAGAAAQGGRPDDRSVALIRVTAAE